MLTEQSITLYVKLNYWELYGASVRSLARMFRRVLYLWAAIAMLCLLLVLFITFRPASEKDWQQMAEIRPALAWFLAIPLVLVYALPLFSASKMIKGGRTNEGFGYSFSDAGMHVESSVGKTDLTWAAFASATETLESFFLFTTRSVAYTFPKRCFVSETDVGNFRKIVREHVTKVKLFDT